MNMLLTKLFIIKNRREENYGKETDAAGRFIFPLFPNTIDWKLLSNK